MGIDPAWSSLAFGIVVTQFADGIVQILHADEYHRPDYNEMLSIVYIDDANTMLIRYTLMVLILLLSNH
jgi:hypothetical protein